VAEAPIRVEYALTNEGQEFIRAIAPLMNWASMKHVRQ
jgi:DNA-binding HxlR family transcriptional regulator